MSKAWGGVGAWALDAERAEEEEHERAAAEGPAPAASSEAAGDSLSFPSLQEAVTTKSKKKKPVSVSLSEFNNGVQLGRGAGGRPSSDPKGLTHDEMRRLPTGPRERSAEELEASRGGFRSYGYGGGGMRGGVGGGFGGGRADDDGRRPYGGGGGGGFDDEPRRQSRAFEFDQPSREEAVDNWAAGKRSMGPPSDHGRQDRYGMLGGGGPSRADDAGSWSSAKKPLPIRQQSYTSGFRDAANPIEGDRWSREGPPPLMSRNGEFERKKLVLDPPKVATAAPDAAPAKPRSSVFGAARPREEVLAERGLDWKKMESEVETKRAGRPSSSHSSRPSSAQSSRPGSPGAQGVVSGAFVVEGLPKTRPKVNPFGDAKPREVLLQEQGKDWRRMDLELEHRRVDRPETVQENLLKEEIDRLKKALSSEAQEKNMHDESAQPPTEEYDSLCELVRQKEKDLELLVHELDDKVRFGQRSTETRPGSGAGRVAVSPDRPPSQSGRSEDSRPSDFVGRAYTRTGSGPIVEPVDGRSGFRGGRERNNLDSRSFDRPASRARW